MTYFWARFFQLFMGEKKSYLKKIYFSIRTKKLHNIFFIQIFFKNIWDFLGGQDRFFRASCFDYFGYHSKGCLSVALFSTLFGIDT